MASQGRNFDLTNIHTENLTVNFTNFRSDRTIVSDFFHVPEINGFWWVILEFIYSIFFLTLWLYVLGKSSSLQLTDLLRSLQLHHHPRSRSSSKSRIRRLRVVSVSRSAFTKSATPPRATKCSSQTICSKSDRSMSKSTQHQSAIWTRIIVKNRTVFTIGILCVKFIQMITTAHLLSIGAQKNRSISTAQSHSIATVDLMEHHSCRVAIRSVWTFWAWARLHRCWMTKSLLTSHS